MHKELLQKVISYLAQKRRDCRCTGKRVVSILACVVVFCTAYVLIRPASTLEETETMQEAPQCGKTEHTHSEACYIKTDTASRRVPVCTTESLGVHEHTEACRDENGQYCCGYADFVVHEHNSDCFDEEGKLLCALPEIEAHTHDASCYTQPETEQEQEEAENDPTQEADEPTQEEDNPDQETDGVSQEPGGTDQEPGEVTQETSDPSQEEGDPSQTEGNPGQEEDNPDQETGEAFQETSDPTQDISDPNQIMDETFQETSGSGEVIQEITNPDLGAGNVVEEITNPDQETSEPIEETAEQLQETNESVQGTAEQDLTCDKQEIILHEHTQECFDENENLICGKTQVLEHVHTEACFQTEEGNTDTETPTCDLEEHTHSAACNVIGLIEALPTRQSVEERIAAFEEAGDEEGREAYLTELKIQLKEACDAYAALPEEEQAKVTNRNRLAELEWLQDDSQQETADVTVTNADNTEADVVPWESDTTAVQEKLQDELHSINLGYTIQQVEYYQINELKEGSATVTYNNDSGLSADKDDKVFVYDLGTDGAEEMKLCDVGEDPTKEGDTITGFSFTPVQVQEATSEDNDAHVYAFLSAEPVTLEDMGIYPGELQGDGTWVAMDGPNADSANVKVTITLEEGTEPDGYFPFIRKVDEREAYYPDGDAVRSAVGEFNDMQCYEIQWGEKKGDVTYILETDTGYCQNAEIQLEYLKTDARLKGEAGGRKLRIFSSQNENGTNLEEIPEPAENVKVENDTYKGFTFNATEPSPYVFVSEKVAKGYVDALAIGKLIDGSAPFDTTDDAGYDSSNSNKIVRSYDSIEYTLVATFAARDRVTVQETADVYFEMTLEKSATAARFDTSKMLWVGENYSVEYMNAAGEVIMVMAHNGKYYLPKKNPDGSVYRDEHGFAQADISPDTQVFMNGQVNGSTSEEKSYKVTSGGVVKQRLVGWTTIHEEGKNVLAGTQKFPMAVEVRNADNGESFAPTFRMWLEGNEENYGQEIIQDSTLINAQPNTDNILDISNTENEVKVSAGTNFNVQLKKNGDMSYKNWFDFSTGQVVEQSIREELVRLANLKENHGESDPAKFTENGEELSEEKKKKYANCRYGRITCYGIALQLYNYAENPNDQAAKGLRGLSLPVGDITFDLNFYSEVKSSAGAEIDKDQYTAILWDYNENIPANYSSIYRYLDPDRGTVKTPGDGKGNGGRNIYWDGESRSPYAKGAAPSWFMGYHDGCYYGGDWALLDGTDKEAKINDIATPALVLGTGEDTTYHFSVSNYDFDFDNQHFPTQDAGNSGSVAGYDTYAKCFSAGCVQVLSVFPMVQKVSEAEVFLNCEVNNLHLTTRAGQELKAADGDGTKINHEMNTGDNTKRNQIVLYAPGDLTKGSSFNGKHKDKEPEATNVGFLGTDYWTTSYDCSTFAGDKIWIISYGMLSSGSDCRMRSMNLLQLFDSRALSIRGEPRLRWDYDPAYDTKGEEKFLYAADPKYPAGYDTNQEGVLEHMNSVREEDLLYYTSLEKLKEANYTCIGVLMEVRNCNILGGKYQYMRIPVEVAGDDKELVGKTVATVNTCRVWSYDLSDQITWENGNWDEKNGKNVLEGYAVPNSGSNGNDQYSGELANRDEPKKSPPYYKKTEYKDGHQVTGTHAGGTLSGNSLLILSYQAGINIGVDHKTSTGQISYNLGDGETVVDYRLKNIHTEISDPTSQNDAPPTTLTVQAVLDEGHTGTQRISVSGGSYQMNGYAVDENGTIVGKEKTFRISDDENRPTVLAFKGSDEKEHCIKIYAQLGAANRSVTFVIEGAPVGIELPDITFKANFAAVTVFEDNDTIKTSAYISGKGDNRAYDEAKGNTDNITVGIVLRSGTNLTKAVDTRYIELDGKITYDVIYTNSGTEVIDKIYFYDLLPYAGDSRGSGFEGGITIERVDVSFSGGDEAQKVETQDEGNDTLAEATVYYSTVASSTLYDRVRAFGGNVSVDGKISGMSSNNIENMLNENFKLLGTIKGNSFEYDDGYKRLSVEDKSKITGLYMKTEKLQKGQTVDMEITVKTEGNQANDWYKNIANNWIADGATLPLTSNQVETQVVSRSISGVVWHDENLNGIRDEENTFLLSGVTVTLFKKGEDGRYEICKTDVTGETISTVTTGTDGAYSFNNLEAGEYIVAFSGDILDEYTGVTSYQVKGQNDDNTSDGIANGNLFSDGSYKYYIKYSTDSESMTLHSIEQMGTVVLSNGQEQYLNQDLGLISDTFELPMTGGSGTTVYIIVGLLLTTMSAMFFWYTRKRNRTEDSASSR